MRFKELEVGQTFSLTHLIYQKVGNNHAVLIDRVCATRLGTICEIWEEAEILKLSVLLKFVGKIEFSKIKLYQSFSHDLVAYTKVDTNVGVKIASDVGVREEFKLDQMVEKIEVIYLKGEIFNVTE